MVMMMMMIAFQAQISVTEPSILDFVNKQMHGGEVEVGWVPSRWKLAVEVASWLRSQELGTH
eukprot:3501395-Karenia_brevis.AAC.1